MRTTRSLMLTALVMLAPSLAEAQAPVTAADLARLDATVGEIRRDVEDLRRTDATLAADVDRTLDEVSDEVIYLRVKMRREGSVTRNEYAAIRDRLETLRVRAQGQRVSAMPALDDPIPARGGVVPVGTEFDVRLQTSLSSATAKPEQRFEATTMVDYPADGPGLIVPTGSLVRGFVSSVSPAGRLDRRGNITLSFDEIRIGNRSYRLRGSVAQALDPAMAQDATRIGVGAVAGAILGGLIVGGKGALVGVLVGSGGTMAATEGTDVELPAGTILRIRLDQPLDVVAP